LSADITVTASDLGLGSPIVASKIISGTAYAGGCVQLSQDGTQIISLNVGCGGAGGGVTSVTASSPLASSGSGNPNITCQTASGSQAGCIAAADFATFAAKQNALGFTAENVANKNANNGYAGLDSGGKVPYANLSGAPSITTTSPMTNTGFAIGMSAATDSVPGYLTAADHSKVTAAVPNTTTVNGHALSSNVAVTAADLGLATVATSGSYNDLSNKPTITMAGRLLKITYLTTSGTFTTTANTGTALVKMIGGGGGAGGAKTGAGYFKAASGANSGAYGEKLLSVSSSYPYDCTVGAAGVGGANTGADGTAGGYTSFVVGMTSYITAGGAPGDGDTDTVSAYAITPAQEVYSDCTLMDFCSPGKIGGYGIRINSVKGSAGKGADSFLGAGGYGYSSAYPYPGDSGRGYGSGGGGGSNITGGAAGGDGAPGLIIIEEYSN
jgi:hypothetical protein